MSHSNLGDSALFTGVLAQLAGTIDARAKGGDAATSWTAKLLAAGPEACAGKVAEEGRELADAVRGESDDRVLSEAGDLLYHMLVALRVRGLSLDDVAKVLADRQGISGIAEKASR